MSNAFICRLGSPAHYILSDSTFKVPWRNSTGRTIYPFFHLSDPSVQPVDSITYQGHSHRYGPIITDAPSGPGHGRRRRRSCTGKSYSYNVPGFAKVACGFESWLGQKKERTRSSGSRDTRTCGCWPWNVRDPTWRKNHITVGFGGSALNHSRTSQTKVLSASGSTICYTQDHGYSEHRSNVAARFKDDDVYSTVSLKYSLRIGFDIA